MPALPIWKAGLEGVEQDAYTRGETYINGELDGQWLLEPGPQTKVRVLTSQVTRRVRVTLANQGGDVDSVPHLLTRLIRAYRHVGWHVETDESYLIFSQPK